MTAPVETEPAKSLREEILDKIAALITVALGLVAALAWNGAIQATFEQFFGTAGGPLSAMYVYATIVTIVAVIATIWIGRSASRARQMAHGGLRRRPIS